MKTEQYDIFGNLVVPAKNVIAEQRRKWENRFQRWSNKQFQEGRYGYGACGYGSMCDYCADNTYGRPCVRALNKMCREKGITIDYEKTSFEEAWEGVFNAEENQQ